MNFVLDFDTQSDSSQSGDTPAFNYHQPPPSRLVPAPLAPQHPQHTTASPGCGTRRRRSRGRPTIRGNPDSPRPPSQVSFAFSLRFSVTNKYLQVIFRLLGRLSDEYHLDLPLRRLYTPRKALASAGITHWTTHSHPRSAIPAYSTLSSHTRSTRSLPTPRTYHVAPDDEEKTRSYATR
jgi:hypothetical protein